MPSEFHPHRLGRSGEAEAERFLRRKGYRIVERRFRFLRGEIDIVARDRGCLVFVEVKTRSEETFGFGEDAVGRNKQKQIRRTAEGYLLKNGIRHTPCRFDVIILLPGKAKRFRIRHYERAFE